MTPNPQQDFVLKTIKSRDVHFVRFWFTDVMGNMKSFAVIPSELDNAFADGMGFDGSCIEGTVEDSILFPGVVVEPGAVIRNCVLFKETVIHSNAHLAYIIADKDVEVLEGRTLMGHATYPIVLAKGSKV